MVYIKTELRKLPVLTGPFYRFDIKDAPHSPIDLFMEWLNLAIELQVKEPHATTLSTVDADGFPDARVLLLKNVDHEGWHFAAQRSSPKGQQIKSNANVALTFYWPSLGRQIRIRGRAHDMGSDARDADFLARPLSSRAAGLLGRQSQVLHHHEEISSGITRQLERIAQEPGIVAPDWGVFAVRAEQVEFWQGSTDRQHVRIRYRWAQKGWSLDRLWP